MTTKRRRGEMGRIGWIKAGLIAGSLMASAIGAQMLVGQEAAATKASSTLAEQTLPRAAAESSAPAFRTVQAAPSFQPRFAPITRSRSS